MELFSGDGEMGKNILYFYLQTRQSDLMTYLKTIEKILDNGFEFKQKKINYYFLFLQSLTFYKTEIKPQTREFLLKLILKMIEKGMKISTVCVYYDHITNINACVLLIDKMHQKKPFCFGRKGFGSSVDEYIELQFSSIIFNLGITFENIFTQDDLVFDQEINLMVEPTDNIKFLCKIKNRSCFQDYEQKIWEIKNKKYTEY